MFSFFKDKIVLKELIPKDHIDIHSHLLPGIDDGASTFEDTLQLTKTLQDFGISELITTPHVIQNIWDNSSEKIKKSEANTIINLKKNGISIPFRAAAEYLMDDQFVRLFQSGDLLTIKDNYVLVEMSYSNPPIQLYSIIFDLRVAGYTPILAHPERYTYYHYDFESYRKLKKAGCYFQLNLLSVVGYYGIGISKVAAKLLQEGLYDFVGSDTHHKNHIAAFDQKVQLKDLIPLKEIIANNQIFKSE